MAARANLTKLERLASDACYEAAEDVGLDGAGISSTRRDSKPPTDLAGLVHQAVLPGGRRVPILKTLLTNACERNCYYCAFRAGRDAPRVTFQPDELAASFDQLHRAGIVQGIFVSSGLAGGGVRTQDRLIETAEILRTRYTYTGYLHLKLMPGAEFAQVEQAMQLADRVSVNLEAPNLETLARLAPRKQLVEELVQPLRYVQQIRQRHGGQPGNWGNPFRSGPSQTTQFVVGPGGESDQDLLRTTAYLRKSVGLARTYFMAFRPVPGTPLEDQPPESALRQRRLYQSDFLLRDYGFRSEELFFDEQGNLPVDEDPKQAWARRFLSNAPVEINSAERQELLRVPGIGPVGVDRLLHARRQGALRELSDLRKLGVIAERAAPYILMDGRRPAYQLRLW
jgi:predicted DNA-binding helix-hairpin-helix protein